jgi:hypothetical protein
MSVWTGLFDGEGLRDLSLQFGAALLRTLHEKSWHQVRNGTERVFGMQQAMLFSPQCCFWLPTESRQVCNTSYNPLTLLRTRSEAFTEHDVDAQWRPQPGNDITQHRPLHNKNDKNAWSRQQPPTEQGNHRPLDHGIPSPAAVIRGHLINSFFLPALQQNGNQIKVDAIRKHYRNTA